MDQTNFLHSVHYKLLTVWAQSHYDPDKNACTQMCRELRQRLSQTSKQRDVWRSMHSNKQASLNINSKFKARVCPHFMNTHKHPKWVILHYTPM